MKLHLLREHYRSDDNLNWKPKMSFETEEAARAYGTDFIGLTYRCRVCNKFHIGNKRRMSSK